MATIDQGGNTFGTDMIIGTTDNQAVEIIVNNAVKSVHRSSNIGIEVPLINNTSINNAKVDLSTTGTVISRDVANGDTTLTVNQQNSGSTGNIQTWQFNGTPKSYVKSDGSFKADNGLNGTTIRVDAPSSTIRITASNTLGWSRGVIFRNAADTVNLAGIGVLGWDSDTYYYGWMGLSYDNAYVKWNAAGLGIRLDSTTPPSYPLHLDIGTVTGANILGYFGQNGGSVKISNSNTAVNKFNPTIIGTASNASDSGLSLVAQGANSYTSGAFSFDARNAAGTGPVSGGNTFQLSNNGTPQLTVNYQGAVTLSNLAGTGDRMVTANSAGTLSANTVVESGTYTPTITGSATTYTAQGFRYTRIGNVVNVAGIITVSGGVLGQESIKVSIPIPSSFTNDYDASGTVSGKYVGAPPTNADLGNYIIADPPADGIFVFYYSIDTDNRICIEFTYIVQ